jgi:hypothetical protein
VVSTRHQGLAKFCERLQRLDCVQSGQWLQDLQGSRLPFHGDLIKFPQNKLVRDDPQTILSSVATDATWPAFAVTTE